MTEKNVLYRGIILVKTLNCCENNKLNTTFLCYLKYKKMSNVEVREKYYKHLIIKKIK